MSDSSSQAASALAAEVDTWDSVRPRLCIAATTICTYCSPRPKTMITMSEDELVPQLDINCARYLFDVPCTLQGWQGVLDEVRSVYLSESIFVSPTYKECNLQSITFPSVASANHFVTLRKSMRLHRYPHRCNAVGLRRVHCWPLMPTTTTSSPRSLTTSLCVEIATKTTTLSWSLSFPQSSSARVTTTTSFEPLWRAVCPRY